MKLSKLLTEAEYVSIGFGRYKEKGKEKNPNSPTFKKDDKGNFVPFSDKKTGSDTVDKSEKPKVNIFDKPTEPESKPQNNQTPKETQKRSGNPTVNKATRQLAQKIGITPNEFDSKEDYQTAMVGAAYEALVDSNYHSEARNLLAIITGDEKLAQKPNYPSFADPDYDEKMAQLNKDREAANKYTNNDKFTKEFAQKVAKESGWDGQDAIDGIAFELRMNGFHKLADKIQSVIKESTELKMKKILNFKK